MTKKNSSFNPYSRAAADANGFSSAGTIIPNMQPFSSPAAEGKPGKLVASEPVVGFLYSISKQGIGEYWPLHIGRNTIGRSESCDICLKESTVSDLHAALNIKQIRSENKLYASIRDEGSKNGIFVNKEELDFDAHSCKSNDIITIGLHYRLLLLLIDAEAYGLTVDEGFIPVDAALEEDGNAFEDSDDTFPDAYRRDSFSGGDTMSINGDHLPQPEKTQIM